MWSPLRDSRRVLSNTLSWGRVLLRCNRVRNESSERANSCVRVKRCAIVAAVGGWTASDILALGGLVYGRVPSSRTERQKCKGGASSTRMGKALVGDTCAGEGTVAAALSGDRLRTRKVLRCRAGD